MLSTTIATMDAGLVITTNLLIAIIGSESKINLLFEIKIKFTIKTVIIYAAKIQKERLKFYF